MGHKVRQDMEQGLTVVVPVWNRAERVVRTLDSIVGGRRLPQRLIVVDNGSTDASLRVCQDWAASHDGAGLQVKVIVAARPGAAIARNAGLAEVRTEWVYFFDSDDDFDSAFVEDVMSELALSVHGDCDMAFVPTCQQEGERLTQRAYVMRLTAASQILSAMLATQNAVYRTSWLRSINGWNEGLTTWDDWELGIRVALARPRIAWLTRRAYHRIYVHDESLTGPSYASRKDAIVKALRHVKEDVQCDRVGQKALLLRAEIVAGVLVHEGDSADNVLAVVRELRADAGLWHRALGWMLRKYVSWGGCGAWRMALQLV